MIEELEAEIAETRVIASKTGGAEMKELEESNNKMKEELSDLQKRLDEATSDLSELDTCC